MVSLLLLCPARSMVEGKLPVSGLIPGLCRRSSLTPVGQLVVPSILSPSLAQGAIMCNAASGFLSPIPNRPVEAS